LINISETGGFSQKSLIEEKFPSSPYCQFPNDPYSHVTKVHLDWWDGLWRHYFISNKMSLFDWIGQEQAASW